MSRPNNSNNLNTTRMFKRTTVEIVHQNLISGGIRTWIEVNAPWGVIPNGTANATTRGRGRPVESLSLEVVILGMVLAAIHHEPLSYTKIAELIHGSIPRNMRKDLGINRPWDIDDVHTQQAATRAVSNRLKRLDREFTQTFTLTGRHITVEAADEHITKATHKAGILTEAEIARLSDKEDQENATKARTQELTRRDNTFHDLIDGIIKASLTRIDPDTLAQWTRHAAVDATTIHAYSRNAPYARKAPALNSTDADDDNAPALTPTDPDAGVFSRTGKNHRSNGKHAYDLTQVVTGQVNRVKNLNTFPVLTIGFRVAPAATEIGKSAIGAVDASIKIGMKPKHLAGDRAYSWADPETYAFELHKRDVNPVHDFRDSQLGQQNNYKGAILVEGTWYSPGIPKPLVNATKDFRAGRIDEETYEKKLADRQDYAFTKHGVTPSGTDRFAPPCESKINCTSRSQAIRPHDPRRQLTIIGPNPSTLPEVCQRQTIAIPRWLGGKIQQDLPYESPAWQAAYGPQRNRQEGLHGFQKQHNGLAIEQSQRHPMRGRLLTTLSLAALLYAGNIEMLASFEQKAEVQPDGTKAVKQKARNKRGRTGRQLRHQRKPEDKIELGDEQ